MATKKAGGSSRNGRDSIGRRLGVKKFAGETVLPGYIIIRQRGTKYHSGLNTHIGTDHSIHSNIAGKVAFKRGRNNRLYVFVIPFETSVN